LNDNNFLISIPLKFTKAWSNYEAEDKEYWGTQREPAMGEFVAYMENREVKAKLKIDDEYIYLSTGNIIPDNEWITVFLACSADYTSSSNEGARWNQSFNYHLVVITETST
jgi:hypothetical protein